MALKLPFNHIQSILSIIYIPMPSLNIESNPSPLEFVPQCPETNLVILDEKRKQLRGVLTQEQRFISASTLLRGLDPDLVRSLAAHYAFLDQSPNPQLVAHARFAQQGEGPEANSMVFAA
jgi:hypothetical protein